MWLAGGGLAAGTGALGQVHPGRCSRNPLPAGTREGGSRGKPLGGKGKKKKKKKKKKDELERSNLGQSREQPDSELSRGGKAKDWVQLKDARGFSRHAQIRGSFATESSGADFQGRCFTGNNDDDGHVQLPSPQNVALLSKDFDMILTWTPGEGSPPDVTYTVRYKSQERMEKWIKVPHCKNIHGTSCNLTCVLPNFFVKVQARVKAVSGRFQSPWVESQFKEYHLDVELAPPVLNVNVMKNFIHVNASFPMATCVERLSWMYDLNLWEAGSKDKGLSSLHREANVTKEDKPNSSKKQPTMDGFFPLIIIIIIIRRGGGRRRQ
ncbi:hypothetical protein llap_15250 [Limosa lapponica baueri]|uniref:Fibronectin type-III domain-containing protein n=1 Tax=Limosa lapponica baueri TaxID=1758121 RepID=A0A2I0TKV9_LIMLA|nr:hypothetical protein llap_15250 [Limosa lapponica baueri]